MGAMPMAILGCIDARHSIKTMLGPREICCWVDKLNMCAPDTCKTEWLQVFKHIQALLFSHKLIAANRPEHTIRHTHNSEL